MTVAMNLDGGPRGAEDVAHGSESNTQDSGIAVAYTSVVPIDEAKRIRVAFRHYPQLDGVRAVSIAFVLVGHTLRFSLHVPGTWDRLAGLGVMLFFVLSGFLITGLLCKESERTGTVNLKAFYLRRALRLLPAFFFFIAVISVLIVLRLVTDVPWLSVAIACLYMRNIFGRGDTIGHLWSLSLEEQFYILWPLVLKLLRPARALRVAVLAIGAIVAWRTTAIVMHVYDYQRGVFYMRSDFRFDSILIGCSIAIVLGVSGVTRFWMKLLKRLTHPLWTLPALLTWTIVGEQSAQTRPYYFTVQMLLSALLVTHVVVSDGAAYLSWLAHPWARLLGRLSYSLYLWQQLFLVTSVPSWGWARVFPMNLLLTFGAAAFSYYVVERPFLELKTRKYAQRSLDAVEPAVALT